MIPPLASYLPYNLRDFQYLLAVAKHLHFGKAAHECHVSQPALSAQIKKLEELLGVTIFERDKKSVSITQKGESILEQVRIVVAEAQKISSLAQQSKTLLGGDFRVGAIATIGPYLWPYLLRPLRKRFPNLRLLLKEGFTHTLLPELKNGSLDAVIASDTFEDDSLVQIPLYFEPFVLAAPKGHRILKVEKLTRNNLNAQEMTLLEEGHCLSLQTLELCSRNRRGNIQEFHATSIETLRQLVAAGLGYSLLPVLARDEDKRLKDVLEYREFDDERVGRKVILVCRKRVSNMDELLLFADFIRANSAPQVTVLH